MKFKSLIIAFLLIFICGCGKNDENSKQVSTQKIDLTKPFSLNFIDGSKVNMVKTGEGIEINNNDKATLFVFFTTWCPPCKAEIPYLIQLQNKFSDSLKIIGVAMENTSINDLIKFSSIYKINYQIAAGENNYLFSKILGGIPGVPYMILYTNKGKYANHYVGLIPIEMLESDIKKVI